ncbi:MAG: terminase small subunit [Clostridiales bacterium]|nr:terminase small subunit [Candidatus Cacconaster stercorequi]
MAKAKKKRPDDRELENLSARELEKLLTDKQKQFVREYMTDKNGTQAAIRAGYKAGKDNHAAAVTASKLLHDPVINAYRMELQKEAFRRLGVSLESICAELVEIKDRCLQKIPVMEWDKDTKSYKETGEWTFNANGATKALTALADLLDVKEQAKRNTGGVRVVIESEEDVAG